MSAGVSDQRMKGQGNQVTNAPKEQHLESGGDELADASWRHQQQTSYAPPISSAGDPYNAAGYYGTTALPYQAFGVGDGTWSTNGTDPMTFLGGYNPHDSYGMDGVFGPSTTPFSTAAFGQAASTFNYFHGNGDYSTWGQLGRAKQYDDYYRADGLYVPDGLKTVEAGVQALSLAEHKLDKDRIHDLKEVSGGSQPKKMTWASIASQPAKPAPASQSSGLKKKGPGMPPPPIVPGKHNMDIGTWDAGKSPPMVTQPPPPPPPLQSQPVPAQMGMPAAMPAAMPVAMPPPAARPPLPTLQPPVWAHAPRGPPPQPAPVPRPPPPATMLPPALPHPVLDELRVKNDYNPKEFDLSAPLARFFVIKSYSEDDIHRSIKYEIWCSTEHGNKRLDSAFREREREGGIVYLLFSVNGSGHFCGMARMTSHVDYNSNSKVWAQDKWKGQFRVRWVYVKDVPNVQLRHIRLENNENKPVTNSRDAQEVPHAKGLQVLRIMHSYCHSTSIFDDFIHYEQRQEEEDSRKVPPQEIIRDDNEGGRGYRANYRDNREPREDRDGRDHRDNRDHRDQGPREHGTRDYGPRDHGPRDHGPRDHGPRDQGSRDHGPREPGQRDHNPREHGQRDHNLRDHGQRDHNPRDHGQRDHNSRDHGQRDHNPRDHGQRDHNPRDQGQRDHNLRDQGQRDHNPRDQGQRDHSQRDQGQRDHSQRDHGAYRDRDNYRPNHKDREGTRGRGRSRN